MKKILCMIVVLVSCTMLGKAQTVEQIFTIDKDSIKSNSKNIEPLFFDYQNESFSLFKSFPVKSSQDSYNYTVNLSDYNVAKGDGGYFRIIEITSNNKNILRVTQSNGWNILPAEIRGLSVNDYFLAVPLRDSVTALIFIGYPYNSEPEQLTIIILNKNKAKMVFNKHFIVSKVEKTATSFCLTLQDSVIEYLDNDQNANTAKVYKIWKEDGILKFGGPYETVTKNY